MSFFAANKNFITQRLIVDMKSLSNEERMEKYLLIRPKVIERLKRTYLISENKVHFYRDVFEYIGEYDLQFILQNLILEKKNIEIINSLEFAKYFHFTSDFIKDFYYAFTKGENVKSHEYFENFLFLKTKFFLDIDKKNFLEIRKYGFIRAFCNYFRENYLKENFFKHDFEEPYFIFLTYWNYMYKSRFDYSKAIFLYYGVKEILPTSLEIETKEFYEFSLRNKIKFSDFFLKEEDYFFPFVIKYNNDESVEGFKKNQNALFENFNKYEKIIQLTNSSIQELLINYIGAEEEDYETKKSIKEIFSQKLLKFEYPNQNEIDYMSELSNNDKNFFQQKLYFF
jgi:hypothetical protein